MERVIVGLHIIATATAKMECECLKGVYADVGNRASDRPWTVLEEKVTLCDLRALFGAVISDHYGLSGCQWPLPCNTKDARIGTRGLGTRGLGLSSLTFAVHITTAEIIYSLWK